MMDTKTARSKGIPLERIGGQLYVNDKVCKYWLAGRCNRTPCRFSHSQVQPKQYHRSSNPNPNPKKTWRNPDYAKNSSNQGQSVTVSSRSNVPDYDHHSANQSAVSSEIKSNGVITKIEDPNHPGKASKQGAVSSGCKRKTELSYKFEETNGIKEILTKTAESDKNVQKNKQKLCNYWVTGNCVHADKCKDLHSWFYGSGFSPLAKLDGHKKAVTGITLQSGFGKLLSSSKDESVQLWDCHSGQCVQTVKLSSDIGCLASEGPWVFVGIQNAVRVWNFKTQSDLVLDGPNGLVYALAVGDDILFAGVQDGSILAWKIDSGSNHIKLAETLKGHSLSVISLVIGRNRLYSGSKDETIRVWDLKTLQCLHTVSGHTNFVTALLCWDNYLLSGALDNTLKVWAATESGSLEVVYEVKEEYGILALSGMKDLEGKPLLFCSCKDNAVRLYELPTFTQRGRIFSQSEIQTVETGFDGLFFTGDATGQLFVWKLH